MQPLLMIDVDGPLNPYAAKPHRRPEGYQTYRFMTPRWRAAERLSLPFIAWDDPRPEPADGVFWKTAQIVAWAKGRSFAWIDDEITDADHAWVRVHYDGHALLHRIDPRSGLNTDDFALLTHWADSLG